MQQFSQLPLNRSGNGGRAAAYADPIAAMVLDSFGTVRYCHVEAARLFLASARALVGRHLSELIPDLPLNHQTPGYNVAYAAFWASEGARRGFCGVDSQGRSFELCLALDRLKLEKRHQILLMLQLPVESGHLPRQCPGTGSLADARADRGESPTHRDYPS